MGERHAASARARLVRLAAVAAAGALYLASAVGWAIAVLRNDFGPEGAVAALLHGAGEILAVLAAPAWFAACVLLARTARQRIAWLAVGLVLLLPLPLVVGVR